MEIGISLFFTEYSMGPTVFAQALEHRGFDSLWAPEHSHIPTTRESSFPQGGDLPSKYYDVMDPFVSLTAAAAVTTKLKVASGICLVVQRDPIQTAKSVASLDQISSGRFLFGVGAGWNAEEMADHGTNFKTRISLMKERIEAMKVIWTKDRASFQGRFVNFPEMITNPKPFQKPYPPIIMGGAFPYGAQKAIEYSDGWLPHATRPEYGDLIHKLPEFKKMCNEAGRDPGTVPITVYGVADDPDLLKKYRDAGVERVVFAVPSAAGEKLIPILDRYAKYNDQMK